MFPHWFFGEVKNLYKKNKPVPAGKIERAAAFERSKLPVLKGMFGGEPMKIAFVCTENYRFPGFRRSHTDIHRRRVALFIQAP